MMKERSMYGGYIVYPDGRVIGKRGKFLTPSDNGRGYLIVSLYVDGKVITKAIHRLVAEGFIINLKRLPEVDHKWPDKKNNHYSNLRWCTRSENIEHTYTAGGRSAVGKKNANVSLSDDEVHEICSLLQKGMSQANVRDLGYPYATVRAIKQRRQWTHISKHYSWS